MSTFEELKEFLENFSDDAKASASKNTFQESDEVIEEVQEYQEISKMFPGGKIMSFGCDQMYQNAKHYVSTWGDLKNSITSFSAIMCVANSPGVFLGSGKTKGDQGSDGAMSSSLIRLLPKLDSNDQFQKAQIDNRKSANWGNMANVNNRSCSLIWMTAVCHFYGKSLSKNIDSWVAKNGTIHQLARQDEVAPRQDGSHLTENIKKAQASLVVNNMEMSLDLSRYIEYQLRPIQVGDTCMNKNSLDKLKMKLLAMKEAVKTQTNSTSSGNKSKDKNSK